jgi:peptide/nickel transport system permease protein
MRQFARTIVGAGITILLSSFIVFAALAASPGNAATRLAGNRATPKMIAQIAHRYGLDQSFAHRYINWLWGVVRGDFGISLQYRQSVTSLLRPRIGTTFILIIYASLIILLLGVGSAIAATRYRKLNLPVTLMSGLFIAVPTFVAALVLVEIFALQFNWFPVLGTSSAGIPDRIWHLTLPAFALALSWAAYVAQISRASLRGEAGREHVMTARGRGLTESQVFRRHILRNGAIPIVTISGLTVAGLIAGSVVVEQAFGIDGMGSFLVQSVSAKDDNTVMAIALILVASFVVVTALTDMIHWILDPRIRARASG